ncbi:hypothetical protein KDD17_11480 [Sulfitobacter albidus]|uniref:YcxB family protein n=1 Tax=Sulfitobacter albidus TaxID=2829501 RepID=A0A975JBS5_9RHOB|nr:hypothetical protein [Sulfitobacter albidus]QUJ75579.1 hypothetical protein KDD17_11480 [Sulfitobacter albidus]
MTDTISLRYTLDRDMLGRAMRSWAKTQNKRPRGRMLLLALGAFVLAVAVLVALLRLTPLETRDLIAALVGFYIGLLVALWFSTASARKLTQMSWAQLDRQGDIRATLDATGARLETDLNQGFIDWRLIDEVSALSDATVMRAGGQVYTIPDAALPADMTPDAFRERLRGWIEGARA